MEKDSKEPNEYFESYEDLEIHYLMLSDKPRNEAYRNAIFSQKDFIKGKTVMDVGTGTGILSIFFAQAGAAKVYAVEASSLYKVAEQVIKENKFENVIEVIHSRVEDLKLPNEEKVDIIVSEWMGFYLLHEGMLDSVIFARDRFLKPDGLMFPESATIFVAPCSVDSSYKFWNDVSGVSMQCVGNYYRQLKSEKPDVTQISNEDLLHEGTAIFWLHLQDITQEELDTIYHQDLIASSKIGQYQGLCLWFTCQFPSTTNDEPVILSTAPYNLPTHWKQTVIVLPTDLSVEEGSPIAFEIYLKRTINERRKYTIEVTMLDPEEVTHPEPCDCHLTKCILIKKMLEKYESEKILK